MKLKIYQVDAFADKVFTGNPAAIVPLEQWLPEEQMQKIAAENNLAETAFFVKNEKGFYIRWFTPTDEVPLCGHATLASAYVLFDLLNYKEEKIVFECKSGILEVTKNEDWLTLNFPVNKVEAAILTYDFKKALGVNPTETYFGATYILLVFASDEEVKNMQPNFPEIAAWDAKAVVVTAKGKEFDFVSRTFGPAIGINEDPVTGSSHTRLIPFWSERLHKTEMLAKQVSSRGGVLKCKMLGDRVEMSGQAVLYLTGEIYI
ncbi:MAG: PhzF family phenazine biosynthesis protein [Bacteroidetes bacterium]|nr:PhzF family phenazine biosynthesis protein [Bacteroidota bacterium]